MPITITGVNDDDTIQDNQNGNVATGTFLGSVERSNIVDQHGTVLAATNVDALPEQVTFDVGDFIAANMRFGPATYEAQRDLLLDANNGTFDITGIDAELAPSVQPPAAPSHLIATLEPVVAQKVAVLPQATLALGDGFSCPSAQVPGRGGQSISLVWRGQLFDPANNDAVPFARYSFTNDLRPWALRYRASADAWDILWKNDGNATLLSVSVIRKVEPYEEIWLRFDLAPNGDAALYTTKDGENWSQVGTTNNPAGYTPADWDVDLSVGNNNELNTTPPQGSNTQLAQLWYGGYGTGTLVAEFNPTDSEDYGIGQTWASKETGEQWTGQGNARISAVNTLVLDHFDESEDGTLLEDHTPNVDVVGGGWRQDKTDSVEIQSNQATSENTNRAAASIDGGVTDNIYTRGTLRTTWTGANNSDLVGKAVVVDDDSYGAGIRANGALWIIEFVGGSFTNRGSENIAVNPNDVIKVNTSAVGNVFTVWAANETVGDQASVSYASMDAAVANASRTGVRLYNNQFWFDNFHVTTITDEPVSGSL